MNQLDDFLKELSSKLIRLNGNDLINKRIAGGGSGQIFNVFDEIPEFVLRDLFDDKKYKIGSLKDDESYIDDENSKTFKKKYNSILKNNDAQEEDLEPEEIRYFKDRARIELGYVSIDTLIPDHDVILPDKPSDPSAKHTDRILQSDVPDLRYKTILKGIVNKSKEIEREKGIDTLYLTLGFLEWKYKGKNYDDEKTFNTPIILLRIEIEFKNEAYYIQAENKDVFFNTHLHHALKSVLKNLPPKLEFPEDANNEKIADICCNYLNELQRFLNGTNLDDPKVHRRMACGVFKSTGIPPEELNFDEYSEEDKKRLFDWLAGERGAQIKLDEYPVDNEDCRKLVPALSLAADSSQHSAVVDAAKGLCFYIEGPPGTGKSQTIVNIISNCLYHDKSVLFLAQKTAALNVVYQRLTTVKLDNQCIAIHSDFTNKREVFDKLDYFMEQFGQTGPLENKFTDLINRRDEVIDQLNKYASFLKHTEKTEIDDDCFSNHDIITRFTLVKNKVIRDHEFVIAEVHTKSEFDSLKVNLEDLKLDINDNNLDRYKALNFYRNTKPVTTFDLPDMIQKTGEYLSEIDGVGELFMGYGKIDIDNEIERKSKAIIHRSPLRLMRAIAFAIYLKCRDLFDQIDTVPHSGINKDYILLRDAGIFKWLFNREVKKCYAKYQNITAEKEQKKKALISDLSAPAQQSKTRDNLHNKLEELSINDVSVEQNEKYLNHLKDIKITFDEIHVFFGSLNIVDIDYTFNIFKEYLSLLSRNSNLLQELSVINSKISRINEKVSCSDFLYSVIYDNVDLVDSFYDRYFYELAKQISKKWPSELSNIKKVHLEKLRDQLKELDKEVTQTYNEFLRSKQVNLNKLPGEPAQKVRDKKEFTLLKHIQKTPNCRITLREMIHRSGKELNQIVPCFLMTPSSVADFLPKQHKFDVCIIDEASQMLVEEAAGAMLRSDQIIVVGDQKQMPPTRYMVSTLDAQEDDWEKKDESILDKCAASLGKMRRLMYHYRSQDESLISFSNKTFYDSDLMIVPTRSKDPELGVKHVKVNGTYNRGGSSSFGSKNPNPEEAEKTVEIILGEIEKHPERSIGVALLNIKQTIRVFELFDEKLANDKSVAKYVSKWKDSQEYFFIKNLENVQGDERDTIIIGTVFGKTEDGKFYQNFGPINQDMGPNRINVLITRAKKKVIVCSSINPQDITTKSKGAKVLKDYLIYSRTGVIQEAHTPDDELYDSPWEKWFKERLEEDGYEVVPQVGVSNFRIDLGVKHKDYPGSYLCGIELDGYAYHSTESARERDHTRQGILESKGWTIFRVWSTDFFDDPEGVYQTLKAQIDLFLQNELKQLNRIKNN